MPAILFNEVPGKVPGLDPTQYGPKAVNVGVTLDVTVTVMVVLFEHCPAEGVKVYIVVPNVAVEIVFGLQVPAIPFVEVPGKLPGVAPTQYGPIAEKVGVITDVTFTLIVVGEAH